MEPDSKAHMGHSRRIDYHLTNGAYNIPSLFPLDWSDASPYTATPQATAQSHLPAEWAVTAMYAHPRGLRFHLSASSTDPWSTQFPHTSRVL